MLSIEQAKEQLDKVLNKARVDWYKPIQIAEVLYHSRIYEDIDIVDKETYRVPSRHWRDVITRRLLNKVSTSSARFQDNVWENNAAYPEMLIALDEENKKTSGCVEKYIYLCFSKQQSTVTKIISSAHTVASDFYLEDFLNLFRHQKGIRRSIDKAYEIVAYSLFEVVVTSLEAVVCVEVPVEKHGMLQEFSDLAQKLLGVNEKLTQRCIPAHIYRVGVTNAADRGLDMWANFGPAIQVKHLTLDKEIAQEIVDQVESDHVVIVCKDIDAATIEIVLKQIGWGQRVRGIVRESELIFWYDKCLRGKYAPELGESLMNILTENLKREFPQTASIIEFIEERGYTRIESPMLWKTWDNSEEVKP